MVLVPTEVEGNNKIFKVIDILFAILNIWCAKHRFLGYLMRTQNKLELLSGIQMARCEKNC